MTKQASSLPLFRKFDEIHDRLAASSVTEIGQIAPMLRQAIDALPQRAAIEEDDIGVWLERTIAMAARRPGIETAQQVFDHVMWHVRRASGVGGSESGAMLSHYAEEGDTFQSAREIVQQKLLKSSPTPATRDMKRGVRAEPHIQRIFLEQYGAVSRTDLVELTRGFRPPKAPWIIGTPDDIIGLKGQVLINDYKAPSADVYAKMEEKGVSFEYRSQLHHYSLVAAAAGVKFHGLALSPFSPRDFEVGLLPVPFDREFARELALAATRIWNDHVMKGVVPEVPVLPDLTPEDPEIRYQVYKAASLKEIAAEAGRRAKEAVDQIGNYFTRESGLAVGKASFKAADFTRKRTYDEEALVGLCEAHGLDASLYRSQTTKVSPSEAVALVERLHASLNDRQALTQLLHEVRDNGVPRVTVFEAQLCADDLEALGVDITPACSVETRFSITRKRKGPEADQISRIRDQACELVDVLEDAHDQELRALLMEISMVGEVPEEEPDEEAAENFDTVLDEM